MTPFELQATADSEISQQLSSGERLLWSGRPAEGLRLRGQDAFLIPFSLLWGGFAIFWEAMVLTTKGPFFLKLWGIPFVLVGLYIIFGRFFVDAYLRRRTFYGVTSERVIIISGLFQCQIKSLNLRTLTDVTLSERSGGGGTITFGPVSFMANFSPRGAWPGSKQYGPPSFELQERAKEVYNIVMSAQKGAS